MGTRSWAAKGGLSWAKLPHEFPIARRMLARSCEAVSLSAMPVMITAVIAMIMSPPKSTAVPQMFMRPSFRQAPLTA